LPRKTLKTYPETKRNPFAENDESIERTPSDEFKPIDIEYGRIYASIIDWTSSRTRNYPKGLLSSRARYSARHLAISSRIPLAKIEGTTPQFVDGRVSGTDTCYGRT